MASFTNELESKIFSLQTMPGLVTEAAQLRQELPEARKDIKSRGAMLVSLKDVGDETTAIKK